jgi:hypothetical protein
VACAAAVLLLLVIVSGSALAGAFSFAPAVSYPTGKGTCSVAAADFDQDGRLDLVAADFGDATATVLRNLGGSFGSGGDAAVGAYPSAVATGDVSGDGKPDAVTADSGADTVTVLLNNGSGTLTAAGSFTAGAMPSSVAVADLNADGKADVVTANTFSDTVAVLLSAGGGSLNARSEYPVGRDPSAVATGDVNGDGSPDVVCANEGSGTVAVLLNVGGSLGAPNEYPAGAQPVALTVADLTGDGKADVAVADLASSSVSVLVADGAGRLSPAGTFATGAAPAAVAAGDLDGDTHLDLAVADSGSDAVTVLLGDGAGGFTAGGSYGAGAGPQGVVVAALNGDALLDVAAADYDGGAVAVLLQPVVTYTITPSVVGGADGHGSINPSAVQTVESGATPRFILNPEFGYHVAEVKVDGEVVSLTGINEYTFPPVSASHTISVLFEAGNLTITPSVVGGAGGHGTVSPAKAQTVSSGATPAFTFTPDAGYYVSAVKVDGDDVTLTGPNQYKFPPVTDSHTLSVTFAAGSLKITPSVVGGADGHGAISPSTVQTVVAGASPVFTFTPDEGYSVAEVAVDSKSVLPLDEAGSYTFAPVMASHTIAVTFVKGTPSPSPSPSGSASPSPSPSVSPSPSASTSPSPSASPSPSPTPGRITTSAPYKATARTGKSATLRFRVDRTHATGTATATIAFKDKKGKVVSRKTAKAVPFNKVFTYRYTCRLKKGTYRFTVSAVGPDGVRSSVNGSNTLAVK